MREFVDNVLYDPARKIRKAVYVFAVIDIIAAIVGLIASVILAIMSEEIVVLLIGVASVAGSLVAAYLFFLGVLLFVQLEENSERTVLLLAEIRKSATDENDKVAEQ